MISYILHNVYRTTAKERYQVETAAFQACSRIITDKLDVLIILPELNSHHLLTQKDQQFLNNKTHEDYDKIQYLLCCLPRKANGWFKKFLDCLHLTSASTGHGDIADSLSEKLRMLETQNGDDTALVSKPIQVSSMHDEDVRQVQSVTDILKIFLNSKVYTNYLALFVVCVALEYD